MGKQSSPYTFFLIFFFFCFDTVATVTYTTPDDFVPDTQHSRPLANLFGYFRGFYSIKPLDSRLFTVPNVPIEVLNLGNLNCFSFQFRYIITVEILKTQNNYKHGKYPVLCSNESVICEKIKKARKTLCFSFPQQAIN